MSFFRRLFNNKPESDETDPIVADSIKTDKLPDISSVTGLPDPLDTAPPSLPLLEDFSDESAPTAPLMLSPEGVTRPLPPEPMPAFQSSGGHLTFGQTSDQGMVRNNNQDSALAFFFTSESEDKRPDFGLFVVADGMGGHQMGEKASAIASRMIASQIIKRLYLPMLEEDGDQDRPPVSEALSAAFKHANERVIREVNEGGTTTTAAIIMGNMAYLAHVGDSRAYLITKKEIEQLTRDHSLVQRLIELGQLTPEEAMEHPQRNVLYRAIGQQQDIEIDTLTRRMNSGAQLLICSDGLWGYVNETEIYTIVNAAPTPQEACDKLVALANTHGGPDNITAVIFKMPGT